MGSGQVILELHTSGLSLSRVARGRRRILAQRAIDPEVWSRAWSDGLSALDDPLAELTKSAGVKPGRARLLYRSPSSVADVLSMPTSGRSAIAAGMMAIAEASNADVEDVTSAASIIGKSRCGDAREHVLAIADRSDVIDAMLNWAERGGWTIESIVPAHAAGLRLLIDALDKSQGTAPQLLVLMDDQATYIGARVDQQLVFTRVIDIGICTLAEPLEPLAAGLEGLSNEGASNADRARELLLRHGIPAPSTIIDEKSGITGSEYLLAIQPVFQRLIVEIKQSIRFNVRKDQLPQLTLELLGSAAVLPQFDSALSTHLDEAETHKQQNASGNAVLSTSWPRLSRIDLLSPMRVARRAMQNLRRGLVIGGVLAGLSLAADAYVQWDHLSQSRDELSIAAPLLEDATRRTDDQSNLAQRVNELEIVASTVWSEIGTRPLWGHALLEIAGAIPPGVTLTRIEGTRLHNVDRIEITGAVDNGSDEIGSAGIRAFAAALNDSALFLRVDLGATQQRTGAHHSVLEFKLEALLKGIPPRWIAEGGSP